MPEGNGWEVPTVNEVSQRSRGLQAVGDELAEELRRERYDGGKLARAQVDMVEGYVVPNVLGVRTVKSAIVRLEELLARLGKLDETVSRIATVVGGPIPVSTATGIGEGPAGSVVERLADLADACHARVSDVEHGFAALGRALGADDA